MYIFGSRREMREMLREPTFYVPGGSSHIFLAELVLHHPRPLERELDCCRKWLKGQEYAAATKVLLSQRYRHSQV